MKPLLFLSLRSFKNGLRRALTSPKRLIGLVFFFGYYLWIARFAFGGPQREMPEFASLGIPFPALPVVDALLFGVFLVLTASTLLTMAGQRGGLRAADVETLFPTPVSPRLVLLLRIVRESLASLLLPLVLVLFFHRPVGNTLEVLFSEIPNPDGSAQAIRVGIVAYLMLSFALLSLGSAFSLWLGRADRERTAKVLSWAGWLGLTGVGVLVFVNSAEPSALIGLANQIGVRIPFFPAWAATEMTMGPISGESWRFVAGAGGLSITILLGVAFALRQAEYLYDQAAQRVSQTDAILQHGRRGDLFAVQAERARMGKLKAGEAKMLARWRPRKAWALVWKEALLVWRGGRQTALFLLILVGTMTAMGLGMGRSMRPTSASYMFLALQLSSLLSLASIQAQTGFVDMLRRVDLMKPLPFSPTLVAFFEVVAKAIVPIALSWLASLAALIFRPELWQAAIANALIAPSAAIFLSALFCALTVLFPDTGDPSQRSFRGLLALVGMMVGLGPSVLLFIVGVGVFDIPMAVAAMPATLVNLVLAGVGAWISGSLYLGYNPSE